MSLVRVIATLSLCLAFAGSSHAGKPKRPPEAVETCHGTYELHYQPSRIAAPLVRALVNMTPACGIWPECYDDNPKEPLDSPEARKKVERDVRKYEDILSGWKRLEFPPEAAPIARHGIAELEMHIAFCHVTLEFHKTRDVKVLEAPIAGIDPVKRCSAELKMVHQAKTWRERKEAAHTELWNCLLQTSGEFPEASWEVFLKKFGVREEHAEDKDFTY